IESGEIIEGLGDRILGRVIQEDVLDDEGRVAIPAGAEITETEQDLVEELRLEKVMVRSLLTCAMDHGVCKHCYGRDLARGQMVTMGDSVGVIAAQSIGEPGTQLTMRTFHIGGTASRLAEQNTWEAKFSGRLKFHDLKEVKNEEGYWVVLGRRGAAVIVDELGKERERRPLPLGTIIRVNTESQVEQGDRIAEWDPFSVPILTDVTGFVKYSAIVEGETFKEQVDEVSGVSRKVIQESPDQEHRPQLVICDEQQNTIIRENETNAEFNLPIKAELVVEDGQEVHAGDILAKIPRELAKNKDITGGLPRVAELFEARIPKDQAVITEIDGIVEFGMDFKKKQRIIIRPEDGRGEPKEYLIPRGRHVTVHMGEYVRAG
ncbi:MAG: DNA-directed RNA polymerase subunit beta', partial [SAR324 cluster bacterium]|nr:DNA-directed RNA polymerase subunit beta' [SAR324 cluster bacterium]